MSKTQGKAAMALGVIYVAFVGWSIYGAIFPVETYIFRMIHMAFIFALGFLVYPVRPNAGGWTRWLDLLLAILGVATIAYTFM
ncbi:MAG: TRAP transporter permease, partial [Syntrophales bacterium]